LSEMNLKNTTMNSEEIKHLLQKYFDGDTTLEEEIFLKNFFSGGDIPEELNVEKEIFRYFILSAEIPEPSADFEEKIFSAIGHEDSNIIQTGRRMRLYLTLTGAAAGLLILAASYFFFTGRPEPRDTYSDPELAYAETMKILVDVSSRLNKGTKSLRQLSALYDETSKSLDIVSRSTAIIEEKMKPLDKILEAIGKSDTGNYQSQITNNQ